MSKIETLEKWTERQLDEVLDSIKDNAKRLYDIINLHQKKKIKLKVAALDEALNMINQCYGMGLGYEHVYRKCLADAITDNATNNSDFHTSP